MLVGPAGLSVAAGVAFLLTILRRPAEDDLTGRERTARLLSIGVAAQCLHFMEEFVTRFEDRFPALLGLPAWSANFFSISRGFAFGCCRQWACKKGTVSFIPYMVFRNCGDGEWNRTPHSRGRSSRIFPGPDHFPGGWSGGCVALGKAASAHQIAAIGP